MTYLRSVSKNQNEVQNWKLPFNVLKEIHELKNKYLISYRIAENLSQEQAAKLAGISKEKWAGLENKKYIPILEEAYKVSYLINRVSELYKVFPVTRNDIKKRIPIKSFSKLSLYRVVKGITQEELSEKTGISIKVINKLEREWKTGTDIPEKYLVEIQVLADYIGCDIIEIIGTIDIIQE